MITSAVKIQEYLDALAGGYDPFEFQEFLNELNGSSERIHIVAFSEEENDEKGVAYAMSLETAKHVASLAHHAGKYGLPIFEFGGNVEKNNYSYTGYVCALSEDDVISYLKNCALDFESGVPIAQRTLS